MANPEKIKVGVIGVGALGRHHARLYAENPGAEVNINSPVFFTVFPSFSPYAADKFSTGSSSNRKTFHNLLILTVSPCQKKIDFTDIYNYIII